MPKLVLNPGTPQAREFELQPGRNFIGRGFTNDFRIEDPSVSVSHAQLVLNGNSVAVKDLGSTNGTYIDRAPVKEAYLQPGQKLQLGGVEMIFAGDMAASTVAAGIAPTLALPHPGQRISLPNAIRSSTPISGAAGFNPLPMPGARSAPAAQPQPTASAAAPGQSHASQPSQISTMAAELARSVPRKLKVERTDEALMVRCLGFGLGATVLTGALWIIFTAMVGYSLAPYFCWASGALCGFALRTASENRPGSMFSMMAAGCCLLSVFIGQVGQVFANQPVGFRNDTVLGMVAGLFSAWWIGGGLLVSNAARRERLAN